MSSVFIHRSLAELVCFVVDNRGRSCPVVERGFPLIATNCVTEDRRDVVLTNVRYVSEDTYRTWFRAHPDPGDILFVCKGSPGRVAVVPDPVPYCIAQDMVALRADPTVVDPLYLYYRLSSSDVQQRIGNMHVGTLIPHFKKGDFQHLHIAVHSSLREQRQIAGVLGALDDLISQSREQAAVLASVAKVAALRFMESVSDRPLEPLTQACRVSRGYSYRSSELIAGHDTFVNLKNIGRGGTFARRGFKPISAERHKPAQVVTPGDLVVSMTDLTQDREVIARPVRIPDVIVEGQMIASLDLAIIRPINGNTSEYLAAALATEDFHTFALGYCNGTTVLHLSPRVFEDYLIPKVDHAEQVAFSAATAAFDRQADALTSEVEELSRTRDELLPLLMSGRLRVKDVA